MCIHGHRDCVGPFLCGGSINGARTINTVLDLAPLQLPSTAECCALTHNTMTEAIIKATRDDILNVLEII